ncbi:DUF2630 family protein [Mycolicibacterium sp. ND9-15]|uniref:DUF2630 family protein n=1 Tax=Mycolicibacterium sp. ND9-15 TaxID=3042320 RepID=UPI002DD81F81|nr:DUF2630 family protein [Mycolicibacterium sp. ND9-15]WSE54903.1 DUF2630 family protein [Mycolicibacterium sp. ND9-15]
MANDQDILDAVNRLVAEEQELRAKLQSREIDQSEERLGPHHEERHRLKAVEVQLDQCWDLLRQRRALRETGGDPRQAEVRLPDEVEGYLS